MAIDTNRPLGMSPARTVASTTAWSSGHRLEEVVEDEQQLEVDDDPERDADDTWISPWSGVRMRRNVRAPAVIRFGELSPPTVLATYRPRPLGREAAREDLRRRAA